MQVLARLFFFMQIKVPSWHLYFFIIMATYWINSESLESNEQIQEELIFSISENDLKKYIIWQVLEACDWLPDRRVISYLKIDSN